MTFERKTGLSVLFVLLVTLMASCQEGSGPSSSEAPDDRTRTPKVVLTPEPTTNDPTEPADGEPEPVTAPSPNARVPKSPRQVAVVLVQNHRALYRAIEEWRSGAIGPRRVSLEALYQQRIYRALGRNDRLADAVINRLPGRIARTAVTNRSAVRALLSLVTPIKEPLDLHPRPPAPPDELMGYYLEGQRRSDIPWQLLASVNFVESRFGRVMGPSTAGALGPMQFLPSTWEQYGEGGDIRDPHDSILAAARYLAASGAPADTRTALFAYNRSFEYVDAIQLFAREMIRDRRAFYGYYFWQVFVTTTEGDVQLTGPGSR